MLKVIELFDCLCLVDEAIRTEEYRTKAYNDLKKIRIRFGLPKKFAEFEKDLLYAQDIDTMDEIYRQAIRNMSCYIALNILPEKRKKYSKAIDKYKTI